MLIGAGGGGCPGNATAGGSGGGSGAVTVWWGSAQHIPDALNVNIGVGGIATVTGGATTVDYRTASATLINLLTANGGSSNVAGTVAAPAGGTATASGFFGSLGFYASTAGQAGAVGASTGSGSSVAASTTTFVSGGGGGTRVQGGPLDSEEIPVVDGSSWRSRSRVCDIIIIISRIPVHAGIVK